ncbi:MAG: ankyrin repeat domain-containing protein [Planctomycetota bacterium]
MPHTRKCQVFAAAAIVGVIAAAVFPTPVFAQNNPLQQALKEGAQNIDQTSRAIESLFQQFAARPSEGITPLMQAARSNDIGKLEKLIADGADVDETSRFGWTPLMFAALKGHKKAVSMLLETGADPNIVSQRITGNTQAPTPRTTALAEAIKKNHLELARLLLKHGAKADPTSVAIAGGLEELSLIKQMHAQGANLSQKGSTLYFPSALVMACKNGRLENVKWLLNQGVKAENHALATAVGQDQFEVARYLVSNDTPGNAYTVEELSAALVHAAVKYTKSANYQANLQIIELLLASGADRNFRPKNGRVGGRTALEFLHQQRIRALDRIERNRNGASQQSRETAWLQHRNAIMMILERAETQQSQDARESPSH